MPSHKIISDEMIRKIRRIHIQTTHLATDFLAGSYISAFKGMGMEFEEVREYQPGDDVRRIDWNVTARMNRPYVKNYREERELNVILAVDISPSTCFGSGNQLKIDLMTEIAAVIAFSAIKSNDKVGLLLFSDKVEQFLLPRKGIRHVLRVIRELLAAHAVSGGTDIGVALSFLGKVLTRRAICIVLSDFISPDFFHEASLLSRRHDLVPLAVIDPAERQFPAMHLVTLADAETGATRLIDTSSHAVQQELYDRNKERLIDVSKELQKVGVRMCRIEAEKPYIPQLKKYFELRKQRR